MAQPESVFVPDIGDFKDVKIAEVLVKIGDSIEENDALIALETDKATMEVPSPVRGRVVELKVGIGESVSQGSLILLVERAGGATSASAPSAPAEVAAIPAAAPIVLPAPGLVPAKSPAPAPVPPAPLIAPPAVRSAVLPHATPSVRKQARELGIDLAQVAATGAKNRITREDLIAFAKGRLETPAAAAAPAATSGGGPFAGLLPWPKIDFSQFGPIEQQSLSRIKALSGANLARNWVTIPHVTNFDEADVTELEEFRKLVNAEHAAAGIKVTMVTLLIKAVIATLRQFPSFNASLDGDTLVLKKYFHIGFAADTPRGLLVPVIRDADRKGILDIARETAALAFDAREGKLRADAMQGGSFSISSLGGIGGTGFTPIINAPEVAILGVAKAQVKPVWDGAAFQPRLIMPLSLSWDHRVVDGAEAGRFLVHLTTVLGDVRRLLL
jgi:pyruvate dehydrogenase E2 component (dihydrolipoamide acetyltransferase)